MLEFSTTPMGGSILLILATGGLLALLYALTYRLVPWLRKKQGYWREEEIEKALMPVLDQVIAAIFNTSEHALDTMGRMLESGDKKALARISYSLAIDLVAKTPLPVTVFKAVVTEQEWEAMVGARYEDLLAWYRTGAGGLLEQLRRAPV